MIKRILPLHLRKKLKSYVGSVLGKKITEDIIDCIVLPSNKPTALFFGVTDWDFRFQRTQHLATGLAQLGWQVIFVEPHFLVTSDNNFTPFYIRQREDNIYTVTLSTDRNLFIYNELPNTQQLQLLKNSLHRLITTYSINQTVGIIDHPFWTPLASQFRWPTVYDCMDFHAGFKENSQQILDQESRLMKLASKVVVTSNFLYQAACRLTQTEKVIIIPNAGDYSLFSKTENTPLDTTTLGYIGAINDWIDIMLLEELLKTDHRIEMIGKVENTRVTSLQRRYKNLLLKGEINYSDLPKHLSHFSMCLIPFIKNDLTEATHPVKIFEYFATGKPVLATHLPELERYKELIYFVESGTSLTEVIVAAENEPPNLSLERKAVAKENDWDHRTKQFDSLLKKLLERHA